MNVVSTALRPIPASSAQSHQPEKNVGADIPGYTGPADGRSAPRYGAILRPLTKALVAGRYRLEVEGRENLPAGGAHVYAPTHPTIFDPPVVAAVLDRDVRSMANIRTMKGFNGKLMTWSGAFPVDRANASSTTIRHCNEILKSGVGLCIYPEGGIADEEARGTVGPLKKGVASAAVNGGAESIIPIAMHYHPDDKSRPGEAVVGALAAAGVAVGTALASFSGPLTRIIAGAAAGAITGGYLYGRKQWHDNPPTKAYNQAPQYMAMLKGAALGALGGGVAGGIAAALIPHAGVALAASGGLATLAVANAWRTREIAHVIVGKPLIVADYVSASGSSKKAAISLTEDLHRSLGRAKEQLTGTPYDDSAPKFRGRVEETVQDGDLGNL